jgi:hypothetical protein
MAFDPQVPFNDLPILPPRAEVETKVVLKKAINGGPCVFNFIDRTALSSALYQRPVSG